MSPSKGVRGEKNIKCFATEALSSELLSEIGGPFKSNDFLTISKVDQSGKMKTLHKILTTFCNLMEKVI